MMIYSLSVISSLLCWRGVLAKSHGKVLGYMAKESNAWWEVELKGCPVFRLHITIYTGTLCWLTFLSTADKHQCVSDYCPSAPISGERRDHTIFRSCVKLGRNGTSQCDCVLGIHMWKSRGSWSRGEGKSPMTSWQSADLRSFPESVCTAAALCCPHKSALTYVLWNGSLRKKKTFHTLFK